MRGVKSHINRNAWVYLEICRGGPTMRFEPSCKAICQTYQPKCTKGGAPDSIGVISMGWSICIYLYAGTTYVVCTLPRPRDSCPKRCVIACHSCSNCVGSCAGSRIFENQCAWNDPLLCGWQRQDSSAAHSDFFHLGVRCGMFTVWLIKEEYFPSWGYL